MCTYIPLLYITHLVRNIRKLDKSQTKHDKSKNKFFSQQINEHNFTAEISQIDMLNASLRHIKNNVLLLQNGRQECKVQLSSTRREKAENVKRVSWCYYIYKKLLKFLDIPFRCVGIADT